jgi:puromycin-sensitive aminopeptidase
MSKNVTRLYKQFKPETYQLHLEPVRESATFSGHVVIKGQKVGRPNFRITLHQKGLKITNATIVNHGKKGEQTFTVSRISTHKSFEEVRLHTTEQVYPGAYTLTLEFTGKITEPMSGMYPCTFEEKGNKKQLIATQFESHHAREVFPCIDEPEAKATFDLTLVTPKDEAVVANTPEVSSHVTGAHKTTVFKTTPIMSTYLLAFVYGEMGFKEAKTARGTLVRTYATPENVAHTDFALETAVRCLEFYEDYFGIAYPLPKADLIALPDFASGAMENWGCITFREQCMLVDPKNTSLPTKQYVAMVVAHELAHMWFGNLVTMRWWTDLWLNEGFASWIEYLAIDHLFPEWQMWTQFYADEQQAAFRIDGLENTHPIEVAVHHPDEIRTIFDTISYSKGASVIHMLHAYLGADMFREGLRHYLQSHSYKNTDTVDLWAALEHVSKKPVKKFMEAWTGQAGYPVVHANVHNNHIKLTQKRFYLNPLHTDNGEMTWPVPLLGGASVNEDEFHVAEQEVAIDTASSELVKLNKEQNGFYRVTYDPEHLTKLASAVQNSALSVKDRAGLLSDVFETAKAGYSSTVDALRLLESYRTEADSVVWDIIAAGIGSIRTAMDDEQLRDQMKPYIRALVAEQLDRLGWQEKPDEPYFDSLLRPLILGFASVAEDSTVVEEALARFDKMESPEDEHPDVRGVVYMAAVRNRGEAAFEKLLKFHEETVSADEKTTLASALSAFKEPALISRALTLIRSDSVRLQEVHHWLAYSFSNHYAKQATWEWMKENWQWLSDTFESDLGHARLPVYAARNFSDEVFLDEYKAFFEPKSSPLLERAIKQGIEIISWQSAWKQRDLAAIKAYLAEQR